MADPTRRQIAMMADEVGIADYPAAVRLVRRAFEVSRSARAALAADGPAVPEGRKPASVVDQPSDEEIIQEAIKADLVYRPIDDESHVFSGFVESHALNTYVLSFARAVLARWGHQPAPPAEGEVGELVARLRRASDGASAMGWEQDSWVIARAADLLAQRPEPVPVPKGPTRDDLWELWLRLNNELPDRPAAVAEFWEHAQIDARARAAELLEQRHPEPVPVAERPWEREGWCDDQGRCWWTAGPDGRLPLSLWLVNDPAVCTSGVMLSAHAIQVPAGEGE